ncbi:MAG: hypothetical protein HEP71_13160 [Roseivirga sp.]|nr:hypothetical protein [Roseivirga sp.]
MDLFFVIGNVAFGLIMTLIGFKVYNPFKGKNEPEKEELWFKKFGTFFKVAGIIILIGGLIRLFAQL